MKFATFVVGLSFLTSKILGLIRDNLLAADFGVGTNTGKISYLAAHNLDTYYAAFRLPDFLFNLLSYGVLSAAFIPIFTELLTKENKEKAFEFASQILYMLAFIMLIVSAGLFVFAPYLMKLIVPGFGPEEFKITVALTRIMLATPVIFTISSILSGIQNSLHKFTGLALAPVAYNLGIIAGIVFLGSYGVYGVAIGVVLGAILNVAVQLPAILRAGFRFMLPAKIWGRNIKSMITLSLPRIFGMSVFQLSLVIDTIIASSLPAGSIAIINFASNIESLPIGLIGITVSIVSFGTLSTFAAERNNAGFTVELSNSLRRILFLLIPITLGMVLLRFQFVRLILGRGIFDWTDTILTANTLGLFLTGLAFGGIVFILARAFYALKDTKTPVVIGLVAVLLNIGLSLFFTKIFSLDTYGLALANSCADIINAVLLIVFLRKKLGHPVIYATEIGKNIIAAAGMALAMQFTKASFGNVFEDINTYVELATQTAASVIVGTTVYCGLSWAVGVRDMQHYADSVKKFFST